ncbi:hypothetical protein T472_0217535 [Youngiibacter fragilis 232.1]|uniref:Uncharacterized protein n=1 Tax=Youngiibacter fragilis 232.1 TaxID=994573 RepID=V7HZA8_9CLOT|nr:hypothetical protein T472_0217535 [Youngiibacter fragilis 232.1]
MERAGIMEYNQIRMIMWKGQGCTYGRLVEG